MSLLYSQIGYDTGFPVRLIWRSDRGAAVKPRALAFASALDPNLTGEVPWTDWGRRWDSSWSVSELPPELPPGHYRVCCLFGEVRPAKKSLAEDVVLVEIGPDILWRRTVEAVAWSQAEVRQRFCRTPPGWRDCGSWLQEANSHAVFLWGLLDLLELGGSELEGPQKERLQAQIVIGLQALARYQDSAASRGLGDGSLVHEINHQPDTVIRNDVVKAALAFARADALALPGGDWGERARAAYRWAKDAPPFSPSTLEWRAHGAPEGYVPPGHAWQTCDLFHLASVALLLGQADPVWDEEAWLMLEAGLDRQVLPAEAESGFHGHFHAYQDRRFSEKAWTHHGISHDTGQTFAHWMFPIVQALRRWPSHPQAERWRAALESFTLGYFLPGCEENPFLICPLGVFGRDGMLEFAGLWHGMNAVYGFAAALALELREVFPNLRERLDRVICGNLQWIAGLHAGMTRESLKASHMFKAPVPDNRALPVSMIQGVGRHWAGSWTTIRGSICNGFSVGDQFRFDCDPTRAADGPHSFNDEEWITHAGGWLAAMARLRSTPGPDPSPRPSPRDQSWL